MPKIKAKKENLAAEKKVDKISQNIESAPKDAKYFLSLLWNIIGNCYKSAQTLIYIQTLKNSFSDSGNAMEINFFVMYSLLPSRQNIRKFEGGAFNISTLDSLTLKSF